ncbi:MAG TPA: response regulator [Polyangiales bacterium]|nr:response regulator [Polyangiales bacterium]
MEPRGSILIVDDDPGLLRTTSLILDHRGYSVTTASSGAEAIALSRDVAFDLTFLDLKMPEMDGVETLHELKRLRPQATVVMMTAYAREQRICDALREGAHAVLRKPVAVEGLLAMIEQVLARTGDMLILLVDDDDGTRMTLHEILTHKGYLVGSALTGEQAIELVRVNRYDAIFLDLRLPDRNGLEVYLKIRELDARVVVFLITAYRGSSEELIEEALAKTVRRCLDKPFEPAEVLRTLQELRSGAPR